MAKKTIDTTEMLQGLQEIQAGRRASFNEPRYTYGEVVSVSGVKPATLRNWLTRKQIELNADEGHTDDKWRLFSQRDVVMIAFLHSLSHVGLSVADAAMISNLVMPLLEEDFVRNSGTAGEIVLHFWKVDGEWHFGRSFDTTRGNKASSKLPPTAITVRPSAIFQHVFDNLSDTEIR